MQRLLLIYLYGIEPVIETFALSQINEAIAHLEEGKARYRIVLKH